MDGAALDGFCRALPGVTMDVLWGADDVYKVGGKMFAVMGPGGTLSFKANDVAFEMLTAEGGPGRPAPYMARAKWVFFDSLEAVPEDDLKAYLRMAHELTAAKLTRKLRQSIGLA